MTRIFCGKCGTFTVSMKTLKGVARVCPKCRPQAVKKPKSARDYRFKSGVPCVDRQLCRPDQCAISLDCKEGKK